MDKDELDLSAQYTPIHPESEGELRILIVLTVQAEEQTGPDRSLTGGAYPSQTVVKESHSVRITLPL